MSQREKISVRGRIAHVIARGKESVVQFKTDDAAFRLRAVFPVLSPLLVYQPVGTFDTAGTFCATETVTDFSRAPISYAMLREMVPCFYHGTLENRIRNGVPAGDIFRAFRDQWFTSSYKDSPQTRQFIHFEEYYRLAQYYNYSPAVWTIPVPDLKARLGMTFLELCTRPLLGKTVRVSTLKDLGVEVPREQRVAIRQYERLIGGMYDNVFYHDPAGFNQDGVALLEEYGVAVRHENRIALCAVHETLQKIAAALPEDFVIVDGTLEEPGFAGLVLPNSIGMGEFLRQLEDHKPTAVRLVGYYGELGCSPPEWGNPFEYFYTTHKVVKTWTLNDELSISRTLEKRAHVTLLEVEEFSPALFEKVTKGLGRASWRVVTLHENMGGWVNNALKQGDSHVGNLIHLMPDNIVARCESISDRKPGAKQGRRAESLRAPLRAGLQRWVLFKGGRRARWFPGQSTAGWGYCTGLFHGDPVDYTIIVWHRTMKYSHFYTALHRSRRGVIVVSRDKDIDLPTRRYKTSTI